MFSDVQKGTDIGNKMEHMQFISFLFKFMLSSLFQCVHFMPDLRFILRKYRISSVIRQSFFLS